MEVKTSHFKNVLIVKQVIPVPAFKPDPLQQHTVLLATGEQLLPLSYLLSVRYALLQALQNAVVESDIHAVRRGMKTMRLHVNK